MVSSGLGFRIILETFRLNEDCTAGIACVDEGVEGAVTGGEGSLFPPIVHFLVLCGMDFTGSSSGDLSVLVCSAFGDADFATACCLRSLANFSCCCFNLCNLSYSPSRIARASSRAASYERSGETGLSFGAEVVLSL